MSTVFDLLVGAVCAAVFYRFGSRTELADDSRMLSEPELRGIFRQVFDDVVCDLDPDAQEEAVDGFIAGYLGLDPSDVYDLRGHLDVLRR